MAIGMNLTGSDGTLVDVVPINTLADASTEKAMVVIHRSDDPLLEVNHETNIVGAGSQLALGVNILNPAGGTEWLETARFRAIAVQIVVGAGTVTAGAITFEGSNDGVNVVPMMAIDKAAMGSAPISSYTVVASTPRYFLMNVFFRYVRFRISTAITGTTSGVTAYTEGIPAELTFALQHVRHTDGTNVMPTADAATRGQYVRPCDGTNAQTMKAASTAPVAADISAVVSLSPNTAALTLYSVLSLATTNAVSIKASAGKVLTLSVNNASAANKFIRLYNKASAPTVGTDTPLMVITLPATSSKELTFGPYGASFATGIAIAITNAAPDNDATAVAAGDVRILLGYV